jgi:hypothetical protein
MRGEDGGGHHVVNCAFGAIGGGDKLGFKDALKIPGLLLDRIIRRTGLSSSARTLICAI